jgi:hypothetical protein
VQNNWVRRSDPPPAGVRRPGAASRHRGCPRIFPITDGRGNTPKAPLRALSGAFRAPSEDFGSRSATRLTPLAVRSPQRPNRPIGAPADALPRAQGRRPPQADFQKSKLPVESPKTARRFRVLLGRRPAPSPWPENAPFGCCRERRPWGRSGGRASERPCETLFGAAPRIGRTRTRVRPISITISTSFCAVSRRRARSGG